MILNIPVMSRQVFLGWTSTKQSLAQGHKAVPSLSHSISSQALYHCTTALLFTRKSTENVWFLLNFVWFRGCCETGLSPPVKYFTDCSKANFFCGYLWGFFVLCLLCLCVRLFICALWSPAEKGLTSWLSFAMSNCEVFTFPLVPWVRRGAWLYRFLIFALFLTLNN